MRLMSNASGVFPIAPTPFKADGNIDYRSIDRLAEFYCAVGSTGVTVLGIMGEAPKLEHSESTKIVESFVRGMDKIPVVVGVSSPGFAAMRSLAREAMERGAAAVMIAPIPTLRTDDQIIGYYRQAVEAIGADVPFVLQDYPLTLNVQFTPKVIRKIVQEYPSCVMLKHEDWPGLEKSSAIRKFQSDGSMRDLSILTGNGGLFLDFEMGRGADGAMTGYAFPEMLVAVSELHKAGKRDLAHDVFDAHLPLLRYEQQLGIGLAVRKYVLTRRGVLDSDAQRSPRSLLTSQAKEEVDYLLSRLAKNPKAEGSMGNWPSNRESALLFT
jgi:4-hydroxy-tetrahydrodipicolinate synthase